MIIQKEYEAWFSDEQLESIIKKYLKKKFDFDVVEIEKDHVLDLPLIWTCFDKLKNFIEIHYFRKDFDEILNDHFHTKNCDFSVDWKPLSLFRSSKWHVTWRVKHV